MLHRHRRQWIEGRLLELTDAFAIEIVAREANVVNHWENQVAQRSGVA
jgi:hypothetical protein